MWGKVNLGKNIVKYRQKNQLSQEQLAEALNISRQSISKWETGEKLPSIDNLISLSGLLNISLDELITGAPYLHFPFAYGRPKSRFPQLLLILGMTLWTVIETLFFNSTVMSIIFNIVFGIIISYIFITQIGPYDFKRYYDYWTLDKKGIIYPADNEEVRSLGHDFLIPLQGIFNLRKTKFVSYKQIKSIEISVNLYEYDPNKTVTVRGGSAIIASTMIENFDFLLTTADGQKISLKLNQFYWKSSQERKILNTIISFFKLKNLIFVDKQGIAKLIREDDGSSLTHKLYKLRDQEHMQSN